jgi:hypothetical protein
MPASTLTVGPGISMAVPLMAAARDAFAVVCAKFADLACHTSVSMTVSPRIVQEFATTCHHVEIVHDDCFRLPYVRQNFVVKDASGGKR